MTRMALVFGIGAWWTVCAWAGPQEVCEDGADGCAHARMAALRFHQPENEGEPGNGGAGGIASFSTDTDVLNYSLDIEINYAATTISGTNTMRIRSQVNNLTLFQFRLRNSFTISALTVDGVAAAKQQLDTTTVQVTLPHAYNAGQEFSLAVTYSGVPVSRGFGSINFTTQNGQPLIFTLSEPFYAYTWWPAKDDNTDKATGSMWITVPNTMVVASNGTLQSTDTLSGNRKRYRWATNYQTAPYLFCFSATNYNKYVQTYNYGAGTMPVEFYLYPADDTASNRNAWFQTVPMLGTFGSKYGLYPFLNEKYGIYEFNFGGGMEHQTMTGEGTFSESVNAHELSHQWWGDMVTCATWHDIWLNESFATYSEAIWAEFKPGSSGTAALLSAMSSRRPGSVNGSVYCYDDTDFGRIFSSDFSYRKGGWVLHMLRHVVGDATFFNILAAHRAAHQYGSATTADFQAVAEAVYGSSLDWFFQPWIYDVGAPAYQYAWRQGIVGDVNYVELYVKQTQQSSGYPLFPMPVDLVTNTGGQNTTYKVWNDAAAEHLLFATGASPVSSLLFDPQSWILSTSVNTTTFVEGPPKIVAVTPAPGGQATPAQAAAVTVTFHKNVTANAGQFTLVRDGSGPISFIFSYSAAAQTATLTPTQPLSLGDYTLTVADTIVDTAAGKFLDGEVADPSNPAALPSGDGLPGGGATVKFSVVSSNLLGDMNCDGAVDFFDIDPFMLAILDPAGYVAQYPDCDVQHADVNDDGTADFFDIDPFVDLIL